MTTPQGPAILVLGAGALAAVGAVGAVDASTADPALHLGGLGAAIALSWRGLDLLARLVAAAEALVRDGLTVRHDHGAAVAAVSDLGQAVGRHAEATAEIEREPVRPRKVS